MIYHAIAFMVPITIIGLIHYYTYGLLKIKRQESEQELNKFFNSLKNDISEYKFFSLGHPYTWTEYSKEEITKMIIYTCERNSPGYAIFYFPVSAEYLYEIDEKNKHIFIVTGQNKFDFKSLTLYEGNGVYREIHS